VASFQRYLVDHLLIWHISRRLLWECITETSTQRFRISEDRSFADATELANWAKLWGDDGVVQPFAQLSQPCFVIQPEEQGSGPSGGHYAAAAGRVFKTGVLRTATAL
jgi:hypothetical protein